MHRYIKHCLIIGLWLFLLAFCLKFIHIHEIEDGRLYFICSILQFLILFPIVLNVTGLFGLLFINCYPDKPVLKRSSKYLPFETFMCFRVVTRGLYPQLVKTSLQRNIDICMKLGLSNYVFEVVTDEFIGIKESLNVREVVVPENYQTKHGSRYKARALQYCLEEGVNILSDNDWIIHLDEETLMTESSLIGVINFINDGQYEFGQGVITYANEEIVCWITTLADCIRVGIDYGLIRFSLGQLHRPIFNWKGSFIVANAGAEKSVSFDFGLEGSITEDCYFGMKAWEMGYRFNFIEGEMWEKSTFSVMDYIRQRRRWFLGISKVFLSNNIKLPYRTGLFFLLTSQLSVPFLTASALIGIPKNSQLRIVFVVQTAIFMFIFIVGVMKSFQHHRCKWWLPLFAFFIAFPMSVVLSVLETSGTYWAVTRWSQVGFHIVNKNISPVNNREIRII
ncbi:beta-1,4-mannosyltransferase egh [Patella vulgata]|uniref:beta-1,4-mannosyltransferase egh n=1 Tax=Patella vulgata TaxID=6465 RepID=UPI0024A96A8D|nr:beta-1,4-mannosyltransferase egh [Patella vulgata]